MNVIVNYECLSLMYIHSIRGVNMNVLCLVDRVIPNTSNMVPVIPLFSTLHLKGNIGSFTNSKIAIIPSLRALWKINLCQICSPVKYRRNVPGCIYVWSLLARVYSLVWECVCFMKVLYFVGRPYCQLVSYTWLYNIQQVKIVILFIFIFVHC